MSTLKVVGLKKIIVPCSGCGWAALGISLWYLSTLGNAQQPRYVGRETVIGGM